MSEPRRTRVLDTAEDEAEGEATCTSSSVSIDEDPKTSTFKVHITVRPPEEECKAEVRVSERDNKSRSRTPEKHTSRLPPISRTYTFRGATTSVTYSRQQSWNISHRSKDRVASSRYHAGCCPPDVPRLSLPPRRSPRSPAPATYRPRSNNSSLTNKRTDRHSASAATRCNAGLHRDQVAEYLDNNPSFLRSYVTNEVDVSTMEHWVSIIRGIEELAKKPNKQQVLLGMAECICLAVRADGFELYSVASDDPGQISRIPKHNEQSGDGMQSYYDKMKCQVGSGTVLGHVARTGHTVRTSIEDRRFGHGRGAGLRHPNAAFLLCVAVHGPRPGGHIMAVLYMWRERATGPFEDNDEHVAELFLAWQHWRLHDTDETDDIDDTQANLTAFLLVVAKSIFQDMIAMDELMRKVMTFAQKLVNADRASLFLVDQKTHELYATIFDVGIEAGGAESKDGHKLSSEVRIIAGSVSSSPTESKFVSATGSQTNTFSDNTISPYKETIDASVPLRPSPTPEKDFNCEGAGSKTNTPKEIRFPVGTGIAGHVAKTGEVLNIKDAYADPRFNRTVDRLTGYRTNTILCMPIYIREDIIGVVQMVNKHSGFFSREDERAFEMFAVYCGLALHHAKLYDKIKRSEQKYKVALEVLSYHNTCTREEVDAALQDLDAPNVCVTVVGVDDYYFDPFDLDDFQKARHAVLMFEDLFGSADFDRHSLVRFTLTVKKNYRRVPYHNWTHGFSVANCTYAILKRCKEVFTISERLALFVGSLCHDLDHRGKNNKFMSDTESPLAAIYSTSTMEHHHFNQTVTILQQEGHNIFSKLSERAYKDVLDSLKHCILATDLALFFGNRAKLSHLVSRGDFSWTEMEHRLLIQAVAMTAADLSASAKPWLVQARTVAVIFEEFYEQGDAERNAGRTPAPMMDRRAPDERPASQVGFLTGICLPCYSLLHALIPETRPLLDMCRRNLEQWRQIDRNNANRLLPGNEDGEDSVVCARDAAGIFPHAGNNSQGEEEDVQIITPKPNKDVEDF